MAALAAGGAVQHVLLAGRAATTTAPTRAASSVVLVTHESFVMSKELRKQFEDESGYDLVVRASGDAGALTNKLVLTKDDPTGDAVFGIDNTFGSRAIDEGVLAPYAATLPEGAEQYALAGDDDHDLTPVDTGNVCVNVDDTWFADHDVPEPKNLDDLVDPAYQDLFVTPGATTSSPGLAFLLATIAAYGEDGWQDYWTRLMANGTKLTQGWSDAYEVDFTQGGGGGDRPIVLSYDSSPAFTIRRQRRHHDQRAARHLLPPDRVRRRARRRRQPRGCEGPGRLHAEPAVPGRAARGDVRLPGRRRRHPAAGLGEVREAARRTPTPSTRRPSPSTATSG